MPYRSEAAIRQLLEEGGLADVETTIIEVTAEYESFDDYWDSARAMKGPETMWMQGLDEQRLAVGRQTAYEALGSPQGPFFLSGRAAAARGTRP
jgi:hypothetical protein